MMQVHDIAQVCHEANRALQRINGEDVGPEWGDAPEWMIASAEDGVTNVLSGAGPRESHENWMKFRAADGWVYGETKNEALKTHPCMVPYDQLPVEQRIKDYLFHAIVEALA